MIDQLAPGRTRSGGPSVDRLPHVERSDASRARLTASDGLPLHYRAWTPGTRRAEAALLFVHGIASHGGWFADTAAYLAERGIAVYAPDRRGSGLSGGTRGHLSSYEQALDDLDQFVRLAAGEHPGLPIFLAGSSWAAKLAIVAAARKPEQFAGLLLLGPGLFPRIDLTLPQKLGVLLFHRSQPARQIPIPLCLTDYTRAPSHLDYVRDDPYRLLTVSARFFWETRRLDRCRVQVARRLTLPILLQIGEDDPIMNTRATCQWLQRLSAPDRTTIVYRRAAHTLDFEPETTVRTYRADLVGWLRRQINGEARHVG